LTIQFVVILNSAGFDSERNCVSVIQNMEKVLAGASVVVDVVVVALAVPNWTVF
jgi:hypothetical protein